MAALSTPVVAVEWACHAATTIKDASGAVLAEIGGGARDTLEDEDIAAEIVRRVNAYDELVAALTITAGSLHGAARCLHHVEAPLTAAKLQATSLTALGLLARLAESAS